MLKKHSLELICEKKKRITVKSGKMNGPKYSIIDKTAFMETAQKRDKLNLWWWSVDIKRQYKHHWWIAIPTMRVLTYTRMLPSGQRIETETQCSTFFLNKNSQKYFLTDWLSDFGMFFWWVALFSPIWLAHISAFKLSKQRKKVISMPNLLVRYW